MSAVPRPTLRAAIAIIPTDCYDNPNWKGLLYFGRDLALYTVAIGLLLSTDSVPALLLLWPLTGLCISALFVLGHDAAHEALFRSRGLCYAIGQLALLPSLHGYSVWALGHNRIHHVHTGRANADFVWHPLTPQQYQALSQFGKLRHRIEWSAAGAGLYYLRVVWWERMVRLQPPERYSTGFGRDRTIVAVFFATMTAALLGLGYVHTGSALGALWTWVKVFAVPWLVWNYFIGITVYVHHINPEVAWHESASWTRFTGQVLGTVNYRVRGWFNLFAHNIYVHVPHHVDMRIPFYHLPRAAAALAERYGDAVRQRRFRLRDYVATTRHCKLFDFQHEVWCGYRSAAAPVTVPVAEHYGAVA